MSKIDKVPIEYFSHVDDEQCPYDVMLDMFKTIKAPIVLHMYETDIGPGLNHHDITGWNNDDKWFNQMEDALQPLDASTQDLWRK